MPVGPEDVYRSDPQRLAAILHLSGSCDDLFDAGELGQVLQHQLGGDLRKDLLVLSEDEPEDQHRALAEASPAIGTWADLLFHNAPPLSVLIDAKTFGKVSRLDADRPLPRVIADCIYYAAIAAALVRHDQRISTLSYEELAAGLSTLLSHPWLTRELRGLFLKALEKMRSD